MDDLELLSRLRPETEDPDPLTLTRHRIALMNRATDPGARAVAWRWPRMAGGAAVVAGITAVGLVVGLSGGHEVSPGPGAVASSGSAPPAASPTRAAVVLLANAADAAADAPAGTGDWAYTSSVIVMNGTGTNTLRLQVWEKTDGTDSLIREDRDGKVEEFRTGDSSGMFPLSLRHPTYGYLATLPTDPTALRDEIYRQAQNEIGETEPTGQQLYTVDQWAFLLIGELVRRAAPPALKAALYRVAATIPDVEYVDDTTDAAGRHGIGVAHSVNNGGDRTILIFDRTTYQVMGMATEAHDGGTGSEAVLATGLVENAGQTP
ncbi:CU044_5270 family protein [Actinophytocola sp.]|uniref:CU044_5270 family protein n=1 Tax=Actinophytocola sp. TaxID=1872138 RepID=UPI002ED1DEDD